MCNGMGDAWRMHVALNGSRYRPVPCTVLYVRVCGSNAAAARSFSSGRLGIRGRDSILIGDWFSGRPIAFCSRSEVRTAAETPCMFACSEYRFRDSRNAKPRRASRLHENPQLAYADKSGSSVFSSSVANLKCPISSRSTYLQRGEKKWEPRNYQNPFFCSKPLPTPPEIWRRSSV